MDFGLAIFPSDETPDPVKLARMVEDRGFESLLFPEHTPYQSVESLRRAGHDHRSHRCLSRARYGQDYYRSTC